MKARRILLSILCILLFTIPTFSQGKMMLVGGGGEVSNGWSNLPYTWMVDQAANKKIAIVSYESADNWLPNYLKNLGAAEADNIRISSFAQADTQAMYDSLINYDGVFLKGGDQNRYYQYFKGSKIQEAFEEIYNRGGVLAGTSAGMAVLSGVLFTANNGSAIPIDGLRNIESNVFELVDDFLPYYPDFIFDTHFVERGRTPRLLSFMANWYLKTGQATVGIGVDDRTAFCIDQNGIGTVYGTGAASMYSQDPWQFRSNRPNVQDIQATQLVHGQQYNMHQKQRVEATLTQISVIDKLGMEANRHVLLSNTINLSQNSALLNHIVGLGSGSISIVSRADTFLAYNYKSELALRTQRPVNIIPTTATNNSPDAWQIRNAIRQSEAVLFINIDPTFLEFLNGGETGALLQSHVKRNDITSFWAGEASVFAGAWYASNIYSDANAAYFGELTFSEGLGVLPNTVIVDRAFDQGNSDFYENNTSAIPALLLEKNLQYGIYLSAQAQVIYSNKNQRTFYYTEGNAATLLADNHGTRFQRTSQTSSGSRRRQQYGFDSLRYHILYQDTLFVGEPFIAIDQEYSFEQDPIMSLAEKLGGHVNVFPNPVTEYLTLKPHNQPVSVQIYSSTGTEVWKGMVEKETMVNTKNWAFDWYIIVITEQSSLKTYKYKILKKS